MNRFFTKKKLIIIGLVYFLLFTATFVVAYIKKIPNFSLELPRIEHHETYDTIFLRSRPITPKMLAGKPTEILLENQFFFIPTSRYITESLPRIHGTESTPVIHHSVISHIFEEKDATWSNYFKLLFAAGKEMAVLSIPKGHGYPLKHPGSVFDIVNHFHLNEIKNEDPAKIYLEYEIKISKEKLKPVDVLRLDADTRCDYDAAFAITPRTTLTVSNKRQLIMPYSGKVILAGGHVHEFSTGLEVSRNNKQIMSFKPDTNAKKIIRSIPFIYPENLILNKGDKLDITTTYINPLNAPVEGMGMVFAYLERKG